MQKWDNNNNNMAKDDTASFISKIDLLGSRNSMEKAVVDTARRKSNIQKRNNNNIF